MKKLILLCFLISTFSKAFSANVFKQKTKWKKSDIVTNIGKEGDLHSKLIFERYVGNEKVSFPISSISVTRSQNLKDEVNLNKLANTISQSFVGAQFKKWNSKNAVYLKGDWSWANRTVYIKLISNKKNELTSIFSLTRTAFFPSIQNEIRKIDSTIEKNVTKDLLNGPRTSLLDYVFSYAHAFTEDLEESVDALNENMGDLNDNIGDLNTTLGDLTTEVSGFNENFEDLNENITGVNENWSDTNEHIDSILDTQFMALHGAAIGAATAAGAALGGFVVNMALDGMVAGISALAKLISGVERREILWSDFQKAQQDWEKERANALKIEKKADAFLLALSRVEEKTPEEVVDATLIEQSALEIEVRNLEDQVELYRNEGNIACAASILSKKKLLQKDIEKLSSLLAYMDESSQERQSDESYFCNELYKLKNKIVNYNAKMNQYRLDILAGAPLWLKGFKSHLKELQKKQKRVNTRWYSRRVENLGDSIVSHLRRRASREKSFDKKGFLSGCYKANNEVGQLIKERIGRVAFARRKRKSQCKDAWELYLAEIYNQDLEQLDQVVGEAENANENLGNFSREESLFQDRISQLKLVTNMQEWFTKVGEEMLCMSHTNDPAKEAACMEKFPEIMGPHRALKKIEDKFKERNCHNIFEEASQEITGYGAIAEQM